MTGGECWAASKKPKARRQRLKQVPEENERNRKKEAERESTELIIALFRTQAKQQLCMTITEMLFKDQRDFIL